MICIRKDLIEKELKEKEASFGASFKKLKLSSRFIDWLFNHYYTVEFAELWYDSCPDVPEAWEKQVEYNFDYWNSKEYRQLEEEYEPKRLEFNNWIDPFGKGIWGMSQAEVDRLAKKSLKYVRKTSVKKDGRLYIAYNEDMISIYWYGRDFMKVDYGWHLRRK